MTIAGKIFRGIGGFFGNIFNKVSGQHLTGAEREANAFSAQQAQLARDYETQMSNTAYQRGVVDMQNAGVNPALMYGQGAAPASTPSSPSPTSTNPEGSDPIGMIGLIKSMAMMPYEIKEAKAHARLMEEQGSKVHEEINNVKEEFKEIQARVRATNANAEAQETVNKFLNEQESYRTQSLMWDAKNRHQEYKNAKQTLNNLKANELQTIMNTVQSYAETMHEVTKTALTAKEIDECDARIKNLNAATGLLGKDAANYIFNHARQVKVSHSVGASLLKAGFNVSESGEVLVFPEDAAKFRKIIQSSGNEEDKKQAATIDWDHWTNTD